MRIGLAVLILGFVFGASSTPDDKAVKGNEKERIAQLVKQLANPTREEEGTVTKALITIGKPALEQLKAALRDPDFEYRLRLRTCIEGIEKALPIRVPEGVTLINLPAGPVAIDYVSIENPEKVRVTAGHTAVMANRLFLGDAKIAIEIEATEDGMLVPKVHGKKGLKLVGELTFHPASVFGVRTAYVRVDELKPGSVYLVTPSIVFQYTEKVRNAKVNKDPF